jgi:hypothetical protein
VRVGKHFSDRFPIRNGLKKGDALSPFFSNFAFEFVIRSVPVIQDGLKLNGFWFMPIMLMYWEEVYITVKENSEAFAVASKETGLEVNADKTKCMVMSQDQHSGRRHIMKINNSTFERV